MTTTHSDSTGRNRSTCPSGPTYKTFDNYNDSIDSERHSLLNNSHILKTNPAVDKLGKRKGLQLLFHSASVLLLALLALFGIVSIYTVNGSRKAQLTQLQQGRQVPVPSGSDITEQEMILLQSYYNSNWNSNALLSSVTSKMMMMMGSMNNHMGNHDNNNINIWYELFSQQIQEIRYKQRLADSALLELNTIATSNDSGGSNESDIVDRNTSSNNGKDYDHEDEHEVRRSLSSPSHWQQRQLRSDHHESENNNNDINNIEELDKGDNHHHDHARHQDNGTKNSKYVNCETTVVLLRHCEKEMIAEHCAYNGYERSVYIASLFGSKQTERYPPPSYIFAQSPIDRNHDSRKNKKMNFREIETVGPLAKKFNISIDDSYTDETIYDLTHLIKKKIKKSTIVSDSEKSHDKGHHHHRHERGINNHDKENNFCNKVIIIVWKHTEIGRIASLLGCGPMQGCPIDYSGKSFDQIWQVRFVYSNEFIHSTQKHHFITEDVPKPSWKVYGSIQYENFDPLAFSKSHGDYYNSNDSSSYSSVSKTTSWKDDVAEYPERQYYSDYAGWKMNIVGLSHDQTSTVPNKLH